MMTCLGHLIEAVFVYVLNYRILLFGLTFNRENGAVLAAVEHVKSVYGLAGSEGFKHCVAAFYH